MYRRARPTEFRDTELKAATVDAIQDAVARVATAKAPIDTALLNGLTSVAANDLRPVMNAVNELLAALVPVTALRRGH